MESWVGNIAESYFKEHRQQEFVPNAQLQMYCQVGDARNVSIAELNYQVAFGSIFYRNESGELLSKKLLVKYFEETASELGLLRGFVPFCLELNFYQTMLPTFDRLKPTSHLFAKLCTSCSSATPRSNRNVILFEWPNFATTFDQIRIDFLSLPCCTLMLTKIAQFHARSLHLKKTDPDFFENINFANPQPVRFDIDLVRPMLVRSLQQLPQDPQYLSLYNESMPRLIEILDTFENHLRVPFSRASVDDHCWVMCHQNYGQENVIFLSFLDEMPSDLKIFNCQSMGFASLGVDLVVPLFVELGRLIWNRSVNELVHAYYNELYWNGCNVQVVPPTVECIKNEIKNSVPFAVYYLASRIVQAEKSQSQNSFYKANVWKEDLIINLYKYVIVNNLI